MNNAQIRDKILAYDNEQTAAINELKKNKVDYIGEKIENISLDNLSMGTYYAPTSAVKDTITNMPEGLPNEGFRIDMFNNGGNANIQVLTSFSPSNPATYTRAYNNDNWGDWDKLINGSDLKGKRYDITLASGWTTSETWAKLEAI